MIVLARYITRDKVHVLLDSFLHLNLELNLDVKLEQKQGYLPLCVDLAYAALIATYHQPVGLGRLWPLSKAGGRSCLVRGCGVRYMATARKQKRLVATREAGAQWVVVRLALYNALQKPLCQ